MFSLNLPKVTKIFRISVKSANFEHEILYERLTEEQAKEKEKYLILKHKSNQRKYGYNISSGGESRSGTSLTEEHKEKIRQANLGKKVSQETRRKLSVSSTRRWKDAGYIQHMREINSGVNNKMYGKKMSDKEKLKRNAKPVEQYDLNGSLIKEYISIHQASDQTKVHRDGIKKCCIGKFKTSGGYVWKFKNIDYQKKG